MRQRVGRSARPDIDDSPPHKQSAHGRDHRDEAQLNAEERVDGSESGREGERQYEGDRNSEGVRKYDERDSGQTVNRSNREIDFTNHDDKRLTERDETKNSRILRDVPHREGRKDDDKSDDRAKVRPLTEAG